MHILSLIAGVIAGVALWSSGHKIWAVVVFLVLVTGFWLTIVQFAVAGLRMLNPRTVRDSREFRRAAIEIGVWSRLRGNALKVFFDSWRRARATTGIDAKTFLTRKFSPEPDADH